MWMHFGFSIYNEKPQVCVCSCGLSEAACCCARFPDERERERTRKMVERKRSNGDKRKKERLSLRRVSSTNVFPLAQFFSRSKKHEKRETREESSDV